MKDIIPCTPLIPMGKIGVLKKDKASTKKVKDAKSVTKNSIKGKIPRISIKKTKGKSKDSKNKPPDKKKNLSKKKNENKKESKKKVVKEEKNQKKILKNALLEVGKKRKLSQKNHIIKSNGDHAPPLKIPKIVPSSCGANKMTNGNSNVGKETSRNPWILKLDLPPQRPSTVPNGVSKGGTLALCNKSVIFIPKRNTVSEMILKGNSPLSCLKKDEATKTEKSVSNAKPSACKSVTNSSKETSKKTNSYPDLPQSLDKSKKVEISKLQFPKVQKSGSNKDSKLLCISSCSKDQKLLGISNEKTSSRDQAFSCTKNQKLISKETKQSNLRHEKTLNNKNEANLNSKDTRTGSAKNQKTPGKETKQSNKRPCPKEEKALCIRGPTKIHPQRMASLDAMAKMHVICSTDRRPSVDVAKIVEATREPTESHIQRKSIIESSKKIQIGIKKETKEINGHVIHSRINCVKVEESSISERRDIRTFSTISQKKEEIISRRPRGRPRLKPTSESPEPETFSISSISRRKNSKSLLKDLKSKKNVKKDDKKATRRQHEDTQEKPIKKSRKKEIETKQCKIENTKSKVKVKETIRMRKTCTYQSVTTVSSHEAVNSVVESCSRLGVTTNYETKKTVVTDEACEKKTDLRLDDVHQRPFTPVNDDHCSIPRISNCCGHIMHPLPQATIPYAHSQSCHGLQGARNANSSPHHCDCGYGVHRCGHQQQHVVFQRPSHDCSCCCSGSLVQSIHDACLLTKETNSCAHHPHCRISSSPFPFCSHCHASTEGRRHHEQHFNLPSPSRCQNRWCRYYETCHDPRHHQPASCTQCSVASAKTTASSVPCDQSPLDLSLGAGTSQSIGNSNEQSRANCPNHHCCQDLVRFQSSPRRSCQHCNHNFSFSTSNSCSSCQPHNSDLSELDKSPPSQPPNDKGCCGMLLMQSKQTPEPLQFLGSMCSLSTGNGPTSNIIHREQSTTHNCTYSSNKQERNNSMHSRLQVTKKRKFAHGWSWEGEPIERLLALTNDSVPAPKRCFPAMRHKEGDIIKERDCVLLKSGPKDTDLPYVAKVSAFWENQDDGEMMMSLLWYYRPEHTEQGRRTGQMEDEVFASKHRDVNSVACIEDKCYVLTFNEYCRYRSNLAMVDVTSVSQASRTVPEPGEGYSRQIRLPTEYVSPEMIFFCRHVYDFRQKRILKNPT